MLSEAGSEKETLYGGIAGLTWQRRTRRLSSKRKKMVDGRCNPEELHLNNVNLMEMGYEYVDGEPPAAAAKLRSGTNSLFLLVLRAPSIVENFTSWLQSLEWGKITSCLPG